MKKKLNLHGRCSLQVWPESRKLPAGQNRWSSWRSSLGPGVSESLYSVPAASCPQAGGWWRSVRRRWSCREPEHQNWNKKQARRQTEEDYSKSKSSWNSRYVTPCCDDVRKLGGAGGNLHCDRLKEHKLLVHADGVGASCHVLQPEGTVFFGDYCEEHNSGVRHSVDGSGSHWWAAGGCFAVYRLLPLIWLLMDTEASGTPSPSRLLRTRPVTEKPMTRNMGWTQHKRASVTFQCGGVNKTQIYQYVKHLHLQLQTVVFYFEIHPGRSDIKGDPFPSVERHLEQRRSQKKNVQNNVKAIHTDHVICVVLRLQVL